MAKNIRPGSPIDHVIKGAKAMGAGALGTVAVYNNTDMGAAHPVKGAIVAGLAGAAVGLAGHVGYSMGRSAHLHDAANNARR